MKKILIAGFGDVAERLVRRYAGQADFVGLIRRPERAADLRALGVTPLIADLDDAASLKRLPRVDGVFHFAPPPARSSTSAPVVCTATAAASGWRRRGLSRR